MSVARAALVGAVGVGSAAFGAMALLRTPGVARWCGTDERTIRALGVRDLAVGLAVAACPRSRLPILARVVFDVADAAAFGRTPRVAAAALGSALVGLAALRAG